MVVAEASRKTASRATEEGWLERLGQRETHRLVVRLFKYRFFLVPMLSVFMGVFFIWDPVPWKLLWIGAVLSLLLIVSLFEYRRVLLRAPSNTSLLVNLSLMMLFQSAMIYITGGIESPLLPVYIPICLGAGLLAPSLRRALPVVLVPMLFFVLFATAALYGVPPRTAPAFFELGVGWVDKPVYVWTTAGVLVVLSLAVALVSNTVRRAIFDQVRWGLGARQQVIASLHNKNRELLSVSRTIAHELKNPLASIQGLAQLMARSVEPGSKQAERFEVLRREIARMSEVLEGFRNFTRPLSGLNTESVDLRALVVDAVKLHEGFAEERGVELALGTASARIICDPQKIKQALINMLQNALEATPARGRVTVRLGPWGDRGARVEIHDTGPGLTDEDRRRLFEPGYTTKEGGSGIGLLVARTIAEQHGGAVELTNAMSGGALAALVLPLRPVESDQAEATEWNGEANR